MSTNLSLSQDGQEGARSVVSGTPQSSDQQRAHSVKSRRLDENGGDGFAQPTDSTWSPHGNTNVPAVHGKPGNDQEGEEDVE